jgi:hypothetical protein
MEGGSSGPPFPYAQRVEKNVNNTWTVDPTDEWKQQNQEWLLEANVPGTERCQETLTGVRCELKAAHSSSHMIKMGVREKLDEAAAAAASEASEARPD